MASIQPFFANGRILMLALDHRGSLEKMTPASLPPPERKKLIIYLKQLLMQSLAPLYSGVLLDSEYGLSAYTQVKTDATVAIKPYVLCIEKTGYTDTNYERLTQLEYSVSELKLKGAKGIKILLFFHPDAHTAKDQIELTRKVFLDCQKYELPFFLEILNYSLHGKPYNPSDLVPRSVNIFLDQGIRADVFKLEYPGNAASCRAVTDLLGETPWILLTKGARYEDFLDGLRVAAANGARGFLAGRSIWQDVFQLPQHQWKEFINTIAYKRFAEIRSFFNERM